MARSLFAPRAWERLGDTLRSPAAVLVALDLDGTLAPIVGRPEWARVLPRILPLLAMSARRKRTHVVIVSARPASSIRRLIPVAGLQRVGQYGLEGPFAPPAETRRAIRRAAAELARLAEGRVAAIAGARVERKGLTVAIHGRAVSPGRRSALARVIRRISPDARRLGFRPQIGQRVVDFVPAGFRQGDRSPGDRPGASTRRDALPRRQSLRRTRLQRPRTGRFSDPSGRGGDARSVSRRRAQRRGPRAESRRPHRPRY
jgi:hypothetical protein